jgi:dTDP-4-dehydrorhamnose reductase
MELTILGNGYTSKYLSEKALEKGFLVTIISRNIKESNSQIKYVNFFDDKKVSKILQKDIVISTIPPDKDEIDPVIASYAKSITLNKNKINYLSATSVYANGTVYEDTKPNPNNHRGQVRLNAENSWIKANIETVIYRITGIYGPNRNPIERYLKNNNKITVKENYLPNRIHVEDLAEIIINFIISNHKDKILNISDQDLVSNLDAITYIAKKLNLPKPNIIEYNSNEVSEMAKSFYETSRIVKSNIIGHHFKYSYKYPDYKTALLELTKKIINK